MSWQEFLQVERGILFGKSSVMGTGVGIGTAEWEAADLCTKCICDSFFTGTGC